MRHRETVHECAWAEPHYDDFGRRTEAGAARIWLACAQLSSKPDKLAAGGSSLASALAGRH